MDLSFFDPDPPFVIRSFADPDPDPRLRTRSRSSIADLGSPINDRDSAHHCSVYSVHYTMCNVYHLYVLDIYIGESPRLPTPS